MSEEARGFMTLDGQSVIRNPLVPPNAMNEFRWMKEDVARKPRGTLWFYDDLYVCSGHAAGKHIWQFDAHHLHEIKDASVPCGGIREAPIAAHFRYDGSVLSWSLGPYADGAWRFVFDDGTQAYDVPRDDAFQIGAAPQMAFRIRYSSPDGWITYSPQLTLDLAHQRDIVWHR